jgi:glycosyltransferase involved in cell wall biosynthesis
MRVLLWMTPSGQSVPGGHRIQLEQTCSHLNRIGVPADVTFSDAPDLSGYDLVHGFGLDPGQIRLCRRMGLPVALSTIYGSLDYLTGQHHTGSRCAIWRRRSRAGLTLLRSALRGEHIAKCMALTENVQSLRMAYEMADILLPNSASEAAALVAELGVTTPCHVVPNAVDPHVFALQDTEGLDERRSILYVGRFEPRKNQLGLIHAMSGARAPLVLVGPRHPDHPDYYDRCKRLATGNVTMLPPVPHEELPQLYSQARVHVMPSWIESPGLVSLEAALCGCNIVTTNRGHVRDFFADLAWYCDPAEPRSIRGAVDAAYGAPYSWKLRERILNRFTWEHAAQATAEAYQIILDGRSPAPTSPLYA